MPKPKLIKSKKRYCVHCQDYYEIDYSYAEIEWIQCYQCEEYICWDCAQGSTETHCPCEPGSWEENINVYMD